MVGVSNLHSHIPLHHAILTNNSQHLMSVCVYYMCVRMPITSLASYPGSPSSQEPGYEAIYMLLKY